ncbi:ribonuclease H-like domain-containing protein [Tanacetum coccineum]
MAVEEQVVTTSDNAKALWDHLKDLFHDNKDARVINLDNELRSIKIRKMSINEYCTKIKSMADRLKNLGFIISEKNLVIYTVNGLDSRFATLVEIIQHRKTLPSFETARNMLHLKESSFNDQTDTSTTFESSSSSPTILMASISSDTKVTKPSTLPTFVSTSSTTWQQRLGHPGDEVLRSLTSRHFISCNKEKSKHVCHACKLGKHVKLPFHTLNSIVKQCFDIIHFDLWTSPIHKFHANGTLSRYKARLVANGSSQQLDVDFDETFSPVVKPATIHMVLSLDVSRQWPIHQLDVKMHFLTMIYLRQSPCAWFQHFAGYATQAGFSHSRCDSSLFIYTQGLQVAYLLICVDDIILTASSPVLLQQIIDSLHKEFGMTNLGALNYFLGISYSSQLSEPHFTALKRVLRYVKGIMDLGLHLYAFATTSLVGYTDVDWAGCPSTRRSTSEYRGVANVVAETALVRNLLRELHSPLMTGTAEAGLLVFLSFTSRFQYADIFIKGLSSALFEDFCSSLSVRPSPAQTAGVY